MIRHLVIFTLMLLMAPNFVLAADAPPIPKSKIQALEAVEQNLAKQEQQKAELSKKITNLESTLKQTRQELVKNSKAVQHSEADLQGLEDRIAEIETRKEALGEHLDKDRHAIAQLIIALQRLEKVPPQALIARPGAPLETAQSALIMQDIIPALTRRAEELRRNVEELNQLTLELKHKKDKALSVAQKLKDDQKEMEALIKQREKLYARAHKDLKAQETRVQQIALDAKNLKDLVTKIENDRKQQIAHAKIIADIPSEGSAQLPVSGVIRMSYDEIDNLGAPHKGLDIEARGGALVVAPMGGIIRFAGHFKNYGNMIIVEHKKGYHSLIAGLEKIDTLVGHSVSAGEPLGKLPLMGGRQKPTLYYELRHNGQAVNPARKFSELG